MISMISYYYWTLLGIKEEMAQDRCAWRNITGGPTRASADAWNTVCVLGSRTLNEYDDDDDDCSFCINVLFCYCNFFIL